MANTDPVVEHHRRVVTSWAAGSLKNLGCTLHPVGVDGWDIERPDGSWACAESWRELARIARAEMDHAPAEARLA